MSEQRPPLTDGAEELLRQYQSTIRNSVHNFAEKKVIDDGRSEINETDILQAQKSIAIATPSTIRKWGIRILIGMAFALLGAQIFAFPQLFQFIFPQELPFIMQIWLVVPPVLILVLMIIFSCIFRDDWL